MLFRSIPFRFDLWKAGTRVRPDCQARIGHRRMFAFHVDLSAFASPEGARIRWTAGRIAGRWKKIQTRFTAPTIRLIAISLDPMEQIENTDPIAGTQSAIRSYPINRAVPVMDPGSRKRKIDR